MSLGSEIKKAMIDADINGRKLASRLDITQKYMSQILNDKAPGLTVELFQRICMELEVEPNDLLGCKKVRERT